MNRVANRRGIRLVSAKLTPSLCKTRWSNDDVFIGCGRVMDSVFALYAAGAALSAALIPAVRARWRLSRAKHPSILGHARWSRRLARFIPFYEYDEEHFFRSDGAPSAVGLTR